MCFMGHQKAFDKVIWSGLQNIPNEMNVSTDLIFNMYGSDKYSDNIKDKTSDKFERGGDAFVCHYYSRLTSNM